METNINKKEKIPENNLIKITKINLNNIKHNNEKICVTLPNYKK